MTDSCVNCDERAARWHPHDYFEDTPQFCTQKCAAVWGHRMAEGDDLASQYTRDRSAIVLTTPKGKGPTP